MTDISLETAIERFVRGYEKASTRRAYNRSLSSFLAYVGPGHLLRAVTPEMVDDWLHNLRERDTVYEVHPSRPAISRPLSPFSVASQVRSLRAFFNWCVMREYLEKSPARFIRLSRPRRSSRTKAIPDNVLRQMLGNVVDKPEFFRLRDGAMLTLLATYGPRAGSLSSLRLNSIDFDAQWIVFRVKGDRDLELPLDPIVAKTLWNWLMYRRNLVIDPPHDFVFVTTRTAVGNSHQRISEIGVQQVIYRLSERASADGHRWGPHSIRHWRGQSLADARIPAPLIQQLLGHSDVHTTLEFYFNQDVVRLRQLIEEFAMVAG